MFSFIQKTKNLNSIPLSVPQGIRSLSSRSRVSVNSAASFVHSQVVRTPSTSPTQCHQCSTIALASPARRLHPITAAPTLPAPPPARAQAQCRSSTTRRRMAQAPNESHQKRYRLNRGLLVVFEGVDRAGKSTQVAF